MLFEQASKKRRDHPRSTIGIVFIRVETIRPVLVPGLPEWLQSFVDGVDDEESDAERKPDDSFTRHQCGAILVARCFQSSISRRQYSLLMTTPYDGGS